MLLVQCRSSPPKQPQPDLRGPSAAEIHEATKNLEARNTQKPAPKILETEDEMDLTVMFTNVMSKYFAPLLIT